MLKTKNKLIMVGITTIRKHLYIPITIKLCPLRIL